MSDAHTRSIIWSTIFGTLLILSGVYYIIEGYGIVSGVCLLVAGLIIIPQIFDAINKKVQFPASIAIPVCMLFILVAIFFLPEIHNPQVYKIAQSNTINGNRNRIDNSLLNNNTVVETKKETISNISLNAQEEKQAKPEIKKFVNGYISGVNIEEITQEFKMISKSSNSYIKFTDMVDKYENKGFEAEFYVRDLDTVDIGYADSGSKKIYFQTLDEKITIEAYQNDFINNNTLTKGQNVKIKGIISTISKMKCNRINDNAKLGEACVQDNSDEILNGEYVLFPRYQISDIQPV